MTSDRLADRLATWATSALASTPALAIVTVLAVAWACGLGKGTAWAPSNYPDMLQFWMIFVVLRSSRRDSWATHTKLDEQIRALPKARNQVRGIEKP